MTCATPGFVAGNIIYRGGNNISIYSAPCLYRGNMGVVFSLTVTRGLRTLPNKMRKQYPDDQLVGSEMGK